MNAAEKTPYKDGFFRRLFKEAKHFQSLYEAMTGEALELEALSFKNLDDSMFTRLRNDLAFDYQAGECLILVEHQSSFSTTMPLRMLLYAYQLLKEHYISSNIYKELAHVYLPSLEFYMIYHGKISSELKLLKFSSLCKGKKEKTGKSKQQRLMLELDCRLIHLRRDRDIVERCEALQAYLFVTESLDKYLEAGYSIEDAWEASLRACIEAGLLVGFCQKLMEEFKMLNNYPDDFIELSQMSYEEAYLKGEAAGRKLGEAAGEARGRKLGEVAGEARGRKLGEAAGRKLGEAAGKFQLLSLLLSRGFKPEDLAKMTGLSMTEIEQVLSTEPES